MSVPRLAKVFCPLTKEFPAWQKGLQARRPVGGGEGGKESGSVLKLKSQAGNNSFQNQIPSDFIICPYSIM